MEEKKLTDEEIVRAMKICSKDLNGCDRCPVKEQCSDENGSNTILFLYALDLINRQKAEIERLTKNKSFATRKMMESKAKAVELQRQVDELTDFKNQVTLFGLYGAGLENGRKQSVKDTAKEILKEIAFEYSINVGYTDWLKEEYWGKVVSCLCKKYGLEAKQVANGVEVE